jgi:geranylgeranyl pyrophosphate synthase
VLEVGGPVLARRLRRTEARLGEITAAGGPTLAAHASETLAAGGKRLRPVLVFLCAAGGDRESDAGDVDGEREANLLAAATAVELLHMATLVHDDVLDVAPLRRGRPTVYARGGREIATATGDLLFSRAFAELARTGDRRAVAALSQASSALVRGELMQRADAWSSGVERERYLERCVLKTASLFAASCRLGAVLGGAGVDADVQETATEEVQLASFGESVGLAFQLLDDVLDVSGPARRTGKHRGADLLDGTATLPLIEAQRRDPALRALDLRREVADAQAAERLCDRIAATGALEAVRAEALAHVAAAKAVLTTSAALASRRAALELVADGVVQRYA